MSLSINQTECRALHFVGVLGSGMSAIAQYCAWRGIEVSGSDRAAGHPSAAAVQARLEALGIAIVPQDGAGVSSRHSAIVISTAIEESNPDRRAAARLGVPIVHRSDVLAAVVESKTTIAVAGTSGKSTVTALIFHLLKACGKNPSLITGANLHALTDRDFIGNAWVGESDLLVIEADESDGSCVRYRPYLSVFLNVSKDHKEIDETVALFQTLARQSGKTLVNARDQRLQSLPATCRFGDRGDEHFAGVYDCSGDSASVTLDGIQYSIPFPGCHSASNLLAALSACRMLDCDPRRLRAGALDFHGVQRRFDRITTRRGILVIDDFAHNPDKIRAAMTTARNLGNRLFALFQPHGFGPARFMRNDFARVFAEALRPGDALFLLPIYYAGGTANKDISSRDMAADIVDSSARIHSPPSRDEAIARIARDAQPGDVVLSMGARDPSLADFARALAHAIDTSPD